MNQCLPIAYRTDPFDLSRIDTMRVEPGTLLSEIVSRVALQAQLPDENFIVCINGNLVPPELLHCIRTKITNAPGIITLHPMPEGGKLKTIGLVLAAAALVVATAGIGAAGIPALGIAGGSLAASAIAAGVGLAGSLALTALSGPPVAANTDKGREEKAIAGITSNPLSPLDYLPAVLGKIRISPPHLALPYTLLRNGEVFVTAIVGLPGTYEISNIQINGAAIEEFEDVTYETYQGLPTDVVATTALAFREIFTEQQPKLKMSVHDVTETSSDVLEDQTTPENSTPDWHIFSVPGPGENGEVILRWVWPGGFSLSKGSTPNIGAVPIRIEIKPKTASTWYKLPELMFRGHDEEDTSEIRQHVRITPVPSITFATLTPLSSRTAWAAYHTSTPGGTFERVAEAVYDGTNNYALGVSRDAKDGFIIEVEHNAVDPNIDWDVRVKAGSPFSAPDFTVLTYAYGGSVPRSAFFDYWTDAGTDKASDEGGIGGVTYLEALSSFEMTDAFDPTNMAWIAVQAKGLVIDSISAEFTSIIPFWDGEAWTHLPPTASQNPAALYRNVLFGSLNSQPVPGEIVDEDNLIEWYERCEVMGYQCNAVVQNMSIPAVLQMIASAGWASPRFADVWGVVEEKSRVGEDIMQMLTPLNSRDIGTSKEYPDLPHAIKAEYFNESEDYALRDDVVVYAPGFDEETAIIIESVRYDGITNSNKVMERAQLDIDQLYLRSIRYVRDVHLEGLLTPRGSLIGITDEVIERPQRYSIIKSVTTDSSGYIIGLVLESTIDLAQAAADISSVDDLSLIPDLSTGVDIPLGASIRLDSGSPSTHEINENVLTDTITFVTPFTDTGADIHPGQLVALGQLGKEYKRVIVMAVEPQGDDIFRIFMADEAPEIHGT